MRHRAPNTVHHTKVLLKFYHVLNRALGPQHWWPALTRWEMVVGAILTQNTAWSNVEKAIANLKRHGALSLDKMAGMPKHRLGALIRSSGYFNVKAQRLRDLARFIRHRHGRLERLFRLPTKRLRTILLNQKGLGPETVDSILLYGAHRPRFVIDAYTRRILWRHGLAKVDERYSSLQTRLESAVHPSVPVYNQYHALLVHVGKHFCHRRRPRCLDCPLFQFLPVSDQRRIKRGLPIGRFS